jgi:peptide/nickel transport system permease protein
MTRNRRAAAGGDVGRMLNGGRLYLASACWLTAFPGIAIFVTVLSVNAIGDYLRDLLDPPLRHRL